MKEFCCVCGTEVPKTGKERYFWAFQMTKTGWSAWCPPHIPPGSKAYSVAQRFLRGES